MKRYSIISEFPHHIEIYEDKNGEWVRYDDVRDEIGDKCDCCGKYGQDRRNLIMACGYDMNELQVPFKTIDARDKNLPGMNGKIFTLFVCKECRGRWMETIERWFQNGGDE